MSKNNALDLIIRNCLLAGEIALLDIGICEGKIVALRAGLECETAEIFDAQGAFAFQGFTDSHVHLDKACILDRCTLRDGSLGEAIRETSMAKAQFDEADVYGRAARTIEKAIRHGTNSMRTFVEIDPRAGFRSFEAIKKIRSDYSFAIDLQICAFAQEGLTNETETIAMLDAALGSGADLVGGCPYTDPNPNEHISLIFDLAEKFDVDVDFHLDFDLDPANSNLPDVIEQTKRRNMEGRVSVGHVTKLSAIPTTVLLDVGARLKEAGIALTVLPATDLFLNGRQYEYLTPRGVTPAHLLARHGVATSIATNNVLNPFTPLGDASLIRMANLYANITQLSLSEDIDRTFEMVSSSAARQIGKEFGLRIGGPATLVLLDSPDGRSAVREVAHVIAGWKEGRMTFYNGRGAIIRPVSETSVRRLFSAQSDFDLIATNPTLARSSR